MSAWFGVALLPLVAAVMLATGLPAFFVLIGAAAFGALFILATGGDAALLGALGARLQALLEGDLLQALPLFVMMGVTLNRLPLVESLFRTGVALGRGGAVAPRLSALAIGALVAPMNGSVGASVSMLSRGVAPLLAGAGVAPPERVALIAASSTLGVGIPPSLVLLFLGDAMLNAHTIAARATDASVRIVNTQDIFRATLIPAALTLLCWMAIAALRAKREPAGGAQPGPLAPREAIVAGIVAASVLVLLGGVASGLFYAVEAAATGCVALLAAGAVTRALTIGTLKDILRDTLAISGALFALLAAATTFTLVLRVLGSDRLATDLMAAAPGGPAVAVAALLVVMAASALVLDAFEIVFVIVPIAMPGALMRAPDAAWVAALAALTLQASFLVPPLGYAIMMARAAKGLAATTAAIARDVAPYLAALVAVIGLTIAWPGATHLFDPPAPAGAAPVEKLDIPPPEPPPAFK
ncbi:MAG TPA: TRAP transporter large permease subunit [Rhodoblastus sp.]|nr:TRAP transporter large permease subunit [Rhodoblastus sp.]